MKNAWYVLVAVCMFPFTSAKADFPFFPVGTQGGTQKYPCLDGFVAAWEDSRNGTANLDIYGYLFNEPNEVLICGATNNQRFPAVSGTIVVWQDERAADKNKDIWGFDLVTRSEFAVCVHTGNQMYPDVSGSVIVWQDSRLHPIEEFLDTLLLCIAALYGLDSFCLNHI